MSTDYFPDISIKGEALQLKFLPDYSRFLKQNHMEAFASNLLKIYQEVNITLPEQAGKNSSEALKQLADDTSANLLFYFSENKADQFIRNSAKIWNESLPAWSGAGTVSVAGILSIAHRKVFRDMLTLYTHDIMLFASIMEETDRVMALLDETCYKIIHQADQKKINDELYFIDKINSASPGIIYIFDLIQQKKIYSNYTNDSFFGFSKNETEKMQENILVEFLHPDDLLPAARYIRGFAEAKDGELRSIDYRVRAGDGSYIWQRGYDTVFKRNEQGIPVQIIGIAIDISKEKEAISKLEAREQQLHEAQEIARMGSFEWNFAGGESVYSPELFKIFEMESKSTLPAFLEFVHPSDRKKVKAAIEKAMQGDGVYECEYRFRKTGNEKIIWSRGIVDFHDGKPVKMRGTVMDVTQRHDTLKRLQVSEELHKQAQALTKIGNWSMQLIDNKITWSDELYRIFGMPPQSEEITLERAFSFTHPDDLELRRKQFEEAMATGKASGYTIRIICDDGTIKVLACKEEVLKDEDNKPYKMAGTCQDITAQHLLLEQLAQQNAQLEQNNQELLSFNYIASHDLQEPVRKIKIFSSRLIEKNAGSVTPEIREYIDRILSAAEHMQKLIESLLSFSRTGATEQAFASVDLNEVLNDIRNSLKETIEEKNATLTVETLPVLNAIPFQMRQLFENLISNSLKYSKNTEAPRITVKSKMLPGEYVEHEGASSGLTYHCLIIEDNGIGFQPEYSKKIFELFQRLHGRNAYTGTGVGLAICKKIVQNHNGLIHATGESGKGATFHIYLPVRES